MTAASLCPAICLCNAPLPPAVHLAVANKLRAVPEAEPGDARAPSPALGLGAGQAGHVPQVDEARGGCLCRGGAGWLQASEVQAGGVQASAAELGGTQGAPGQEGVERRGPGGWLERL